MNRDAEGTKAQPQLGSNASAQICSATDDIQALGLTLVPTLIEELKAAYGDYSRKKIAGVLGRIGTSALPAEYALVEALRATQDEDTRREIASALRKIRAATAPAVYALAEVLRVTQKDDTRSQ